MKESVDPREQRKASSLILVDRKLLDHHPKDGAGYSKLDSAVKIDGLINTSDEYWIDCSEQEADAYLQTANAHFGYMVREIEYAIRTARR